MLAFFFRIVIGFFVFGLFIAPALSGGEISLFNEAEEALKIRLQSIGDRDFFMIDREKIRVADGLFTFYRRREYKPAWTDDYGLLPPAGELISVLENADQEGLRSIDYGILQLKKLSYIARKNRQRQDLLQTELLVDLELLLTNACLSYESHLMYGKLDPTDFYPEWSVAARNVDPAATLQDALNQNSLRYMLRNLALDRKEYKALRQALADYRRIQRTGGWEFIPGGPPLRAGSRGPRVSKLRRRLQATGDLARHAKKSIDNERFGIDLKRSVIRFQKRHGLKTDGVVGKSTIAALQVPVEERIRQIEVNMERWRWLPRELGKIYLLVNIADYRLNVVEKGNVVITMRVIVGDPEHRTPVLNDRLTDVIINPNWYVPSVIIKNDILPKIRKNPDYLKEMAMRIFKHQNGESWEIDPNTIDWNKADNLFPPMQIRQDPGPKNFLGRFKFILSNQLDIYLHDTATPVQFKGAARDLSHGCVRVEDPKNLAEYLTRLEPGWNRKRIDETIASDSPVRISLPKPPQVYLYYWTAWVETDGAVHFHHDIYELDAPIIQLFY